MNRYRQKLTILSFTIVVILVLLWLIKGFNLSWVEVKKDYAEITINFLLPMEQAGFEQYIKWLGEVPYENDVDYSVTWIKPEVVSIKVKETSLIKGKKVKMLIENAPTKWQGICKSEEVHIAFKAPIHILSPQNDFLISSSNSFEVQFSTPMNATQINKFLQCDATFYIKPYMVTATNGKQYTDLTRFVFTPKSPLENGKRYVLSFKAGMPSHTGTLLDEDQVFVLQVDQKPSITKTYPAKQDKWIGLYPRLTLESKEAIVKATVMIANDKINGILTDAHHAYFILQDRLKPETTYEAIFQTQVASGEISEPETVQFTTTTLKQNRLWLEVVCSQNTVVYCYQGEKKIKTMVCSLGEGKYAPPLGTYYLQGKADVYEDAVHKEGANFWIKISDEYGFQGYIRDAYWNILTSASKSLGARTKRRNIILSDEDAKWLYENLPDNTMIIIRN